MSAKGILHAYHPLFLPPGIAVYPVEDIECEIVGRADGDTVTMLRGREPVKVRLNKVDAPEPNLSLGLEPCDGLAGTFHHRGLRIGVNGRESAGEKNRHFI